jgi:hypothetical protein
MKKSIILAISLMILGNAVAKSQENLPTSTNVSVRGMTLRNFLEFGSEKNSNFELLSGINTSTGKSVLILNGNDISNMLIDPLDFSHAESANFSVSISQNTASIGSFVNATGKTNTPSDIQRRFYKLELNSGVLKYYTIRKNIPSSYIASQKLYNDRYLFVLMHGIGTSGKIENGYSGFPAQAGGISLRAETSNILLRIDTMDDSILEYYFPEDMLLIRGSLFINNQGEVMCLGADASLGFEYKNLYIFDENLNLKETVQIERDLEAKFEFDIPITQANIDGVETIALSDGRFPVTVERNTGIVYYSKDQNLPGDDSSAINNISDIESITFMPTLNLFLYSKRELVLTYGESTFILFDKEAKRVLYFRERLTLTDTNEIARMYILGLHVDSNGDIHYTAALYNDGPVQFGELSITDGTQDPDEVVIYEGVLSGLKPEGYQNSGIMKLDVTEGSYQIEPNNKIYIVGVQNRNAISISITPYSNYSIFPNSNSTLDLSNNKKVYFVAVNFVLGTKTIEYDVIKIYEISAPAALSTEDFEKGFGMYPNPVRDKLHFKEDMNGKNIVIHSILGKEVLRKNFSDSNSVNVQDLTKGMYIVSIFENSKRLTTKKLIKN